MQEGQRRMRTLITSIASIALAGCAASQPTETRADSAPNVVVIIADDVGYADISAYGINRIPTPNIDRIGAEGVKFTDAYVTAPVCGPSRAGLQTGRFQDRFGYEYNNGPASRDVEDNLGLPGSELTIAQALKAQGYHTGIVGKWHLGANDDFYPTNRGYDEFVGLLPGATAYIDSKAPGVRTFVREGAEPGNSAGRNRYTQIVEGPGRETVNNMDEYLTDYFGRRAVEFVSRNAPNSQPYFLYLAPTAAHDPLQVTQKYYDRFPHIASEQNRIYAAMVSALDDMVGQVLSAIEKSGEADNTMVIFLTDNGCAAYYAGMCACEPLRGGKLTHYEGGVRVPFLVRWPVKLQPGQIYRNPISSMDIFPTALAAAGGKLPTDRVYDGVDLIPYLVGSEMGQPHDQLAWRRTPMASIRKGDWKLWKSTEGKFTLLFNLKDDPNETINLAQSRPDKLRELENAFDQWAKDMQDPRWPSRPHTNYDVCGTPFEVPI